jgi:thymidylate kinase
MNKIIVLCGIDGAGKTTCSTLVCSFLRQQGLKVYLGHYEMNRLFASSVNMLFKKKTSNPTAPQASLIVDSNHRLFAKNSTAKKYIWYTIYMIDDFIHLVKLRSANKLYDIVIYDRYPSISGLVMRLYKGISARPSMWLIKLFPNPDLIVLIDVNPETANKRRPEHTYTQLCFYRDGIMKTAYDLYEDKSVISKIDGNSSISANNALILSQVVKVLRK